MSKHIAEIVEFNTEPIPGKDRIVLAKLKDYDWQCIIKKDEFKENIGVFIPIEMEVPHTEEYKFMEKYNYHVKTIRFGGVISQGLLLPIPKDKKWKKCQDVSAEMGVKRYEKPEDQEVVHIKKTWFQRLIIRIKKKLGINSGMKEPEELSYHTDIENLKNYKNAFANGEEVICTEKIEGTNFRFAYLNDYEHKSFFDNLFGPKFFVGSHNLLKNPKDKNNIYSVVAKKYKLKETLKKYYGYDRIVFYGEIYGKRVPNGCKGMDYGLEEQKFVIFKIWKDGKWLGFAETLMHCLICGFEISPVVYKGPFNYDKMKELAEGPTLINGGKHVREGIVISSESTDGIRGLPGGIKWLKCKGEGYYRLRDGVDKKEGDLK